MEIIYTLCECQKTCHFDDNMLTEDCGTAPDWGSLCHTMTLSSTMCHGTYNVCHKEYPILGPVQWRYFITLLIADWLVFHKTALSLYIVKLYGLMFVVCFALTE